MIPKKLTRRLALTTLCSVVTGSGLGVCPRLLPRDIDDPESTSGLGRSYAPPNDWNHLDPVHRDAFLAIDQLAWNAEQTAGGTAMVALELAALMGRAGGDSLKGDLAYFVWSSGRAHYAEALLHALIPGSSAPSTRRYCAMNADRLVESFGGSVVSPGVRSGLLLFWNSGLETDAATLAEVDGLLTRLGLAH